MTDHSLKISDMNSTKQPSSVMESQRFLDREVEDGPLFRATITQLENRTSTLKSNVKKILKLATQSLEAKQHSLETDILFTQTLLEMPNLDPLSTHYLEDAWKELLDQRERLQFSMQSLLIDPLQKIYELDIKIADTKRRQFEEESKNYYSLLSKYLSIKSTSSNNNDCISLSVNNNNDDIQYNNNNNNNNSNHQSLQGQGQQQPMTTAKKKEKRKSLEVEAKHVAKQRHFDLARFEYYNYLMDLNGGKKEQEILFHLLTYYQREYSFYQSVGKKLDQWKPGLDELATLMAQASAEQGIVNKERIEKRKQLESKWIQSEADTQQVVQKDQQPRLSHSFSKELLSNQSSESSSSSQQQQLSISILDTSSIGMRTSHSSSNASSYCLSPDGIIPQQQRLSMEKCSNANELENRENDQFKYKMIQDENDLENEKRASCRREGFLFSTSKPTKNNPTVVPTHIWHKYWCVLSGGYLHEYSNWKKQLETHNEPINLRFASVREARNMERRFCFEIITPHFSRIYQATSQEDMQSWIQSIHNAIESALNGKNSSSFDLQVVDSHPSSTSSSSVTAAVAGQNNNNNNNNSNMDVSNKASILLGLNDDSNRRKSWKEHGKSLTIALNGLRRKKHHSTSSNHLTLTATNHTSSSSTAGANHHYDQYAIPLSPTLPMESDLLATSSSSNHQQQDHQQPILPVSSILRENPFNYWCSDCGVKNPDWCSLNLGAVICIDCSGVHRSLGSYISKIRSLTLDTTSFTADVVEMLKELGNEKVNQILEGNLIDPQEKPTSNDIAVKKQTFIRNKYAHRKYVLKQQNDTDKDPNQLLFEAIEQDDISKALHALILGADPNAQRHLNDDVDDDQLSKITSDKEEVVEEIVLPVLDIHGNVIDNKTTNMPLPKKDQDQDRIKKNNSSKPTIISSITQIRYALHVALLHPRQFQLENHQNTTIIFPMAELLLQNGAQLDIMDPVTGYELSALLAFGDVLSDEAIAYVNMKNQARGRSPIKRISTIQLPITPPTTDMT